MAKIYITIKPEELWRTLNLPKIFKGGGNQTDPKMVRKSGLRDADFDIRYDEKKRAFWVYPHPQKGLSFSTTIQRLEKLGIEGAVWQLEAPARLPDKLVINLELPDHPLVNVSEPMPVVMAMQKLSELGKMMKPTGISIKGGKAVGRQ